LALREETKKKRVQGGKKRSKKKKTGRGKEEEATRHKGKAKQSKNKGRGNLSDRSKNESNLFANRQKAGKTWVRKGKKKNIMKKGQDIRREGQSRKRKN